jgi:hypothetical protein
MNRDSLPFDRPALEAYLASRYDRPVEVRNIEELKEEEQSQLKAFGYGVPLLIEFHYQNRTERLVLHTMSPDSYGHERLADRAGNLLLDYATFNQLPDHVRAHDVGAFTGDGRLLSLGDTGEFFLLTDYISGHPYARDLQRIAETGRLAAEDEDAVLALADYLAGIHGRKNPDQMLYRRCVRDLIGHGEGIMGILDNYPNSFEPAPHQRLQAMEQQCISWRWRIRDSGHRLSQVHGDFHPWNVLVQADGKFRMLDRSRGEWGEPANDVSSMAINYLFFSLRLSGKMEAPFGQLYHLFWDRYRQQTEDEEMLSVIQPFFAWRALVLAHPVWYPNLSAQVREALLRFAENVLAADRFDPQSVERFLA